MTKKKPKTEAQLLEEAFRELGIPEDELPKRGLQPIDGPPPTIEEFRRKWKETGMDELLEEMKNDARIDQEGEGQDG